jgi:hypothetical protein
MKKVLITIFIFLSYSLNGYTREEKICYLVEYMFIDVAKVCISYSSNKNIKTDVKANTVGIVKFFKNIKYKGYSIVNPSFKPKEFYFHQKEKELDIKHHYIFKKNRVKVLKTINKKLIKYYSYIKEDFYLEPFSSSLYLFMKKNKKNTGFLPVFYNGKIYKIPYKIKKRKNKTEILIDPKIEVEGIIRPRGNWILFFKDKEKFPYRMELKIAIGKITLKRIDK